MSGSSEADFMLCVIWERVTSLVEDVILDTARLRR